MTKKKQRQDAIMAIINTEVIDTQEQLTQRLIERGIHVTQATVSRDINDMRLMKTPLDFGGSRYAVPAMTVSAPLPPSSVSDRLRRIFAQSVLSFTQAQNLVVVKTMPGAAQTACEAVDTLGLPEIVGTLGGENTFIIIAKNNEDVPTVIDQLQRLRDDFAPADE
ncbi:arginine repressor [Clostridia bacterium]|nr:arginine repressor [Clostridia bacterium]